jgi:hypothetical protein
MFSIIRRLTPAEALLVEAPALVGALILAEVFYKFHSFVLEATAFLLTWLVMGGAFAALGKLFAAPVEP